MENEDLPNNTDGSREKFFFNMNHFDVEEEEVEEVEDNLPPPPPVFSEEELEAAKQEAFAQGKAKGIEESNASRSAALAQTLQVLASEASQLFSQEAAREKSYEEESLRLAVNIFEILFPHTKETHGFDELKAAMAKVLEHQAGHGAIEVHVADSMKDGVSGFLEKLSAKDERLKFKVIGNASMDEQDCKLSWEDGGYIRNTEDMALEIQTILAEPLAGQAVKGHDIKDEQSESETLDPPAQTDPLIESMEHPDE